MRVFACNVLPEHRNHKILLLVRVHHLYKSVYETFRKRSDLARKLLVAEMTGLGVHHKQGSTDATTVRVDSYFQMGKVVHNAGIKRHRTVAFHLS